MIQELAWESEKKRLALDKLRKHFLDDLEVEHIVLHSFRYCPFVELLHALTSCLIRLSAACIQTLSTSTFSACPDVEPHLIECCTHLGAAHLHILCMP